MFCKRLLTFGLVINFCVINLLAPFASAMAIPAEDLPGYTPELAARANPQLIKDYFLKRPARLKALGGEDQLHDMITQQSFGELVQSMEQDWLRHTLAHSVSSENGPGVSWLCGMPTDIDWRATFDQSPQLQSTFESLTPGLDSMNEVEKNIVRATFVQEHIIASQYEVEPLTLDTEAQLLTNSFLAGVENPSNKNSSFYSIIEDQHPRARAKGMNPVYMSFDDVKSKSVEPDPAAHTLLVMEGIKLSALQEGDDLRNLFQKHPTMTLLLDVKRGDGLVDDSGFFTLSEKHVGSTPSLWISNIKQDVKTLGKKFGGRKGTFLSCFSGLTSLYFSPLSNVTNIREKFLYKCTGLTSLDLSPLSNVTEISNDFLSKCTGLRYLDLSPLSNFKIIMGGFLSECTGLTSLDLSFLSNVTRFGCTGLTSFDLSPLSNVKIITGRVLNNCTGLTTLDLSPFSKVTQIEAGFLTGCDGLTTLDLSSLSNVTNIGDRFLARCTALTSLDLSPLSNVTEIGRFFLDSCTGLTSLDLSPLSKVTQIEEGFLEGCDGLTTLDLSPLSNVTNIDIRFLEGCHGLTTLDLTNMTRVRKVKWFFLNGCNKLVDIAISDRTSRPLIKAVVAFLRESNNPAQQELGLRLYQEYLFVGSPGLAAAMRPFRLDNIQAHTPKPLADIEELKDPTMVDGFKEIYTGVEELLDAPIKELFNDKFVPILINLFVDENHYIEWKMHEENRADMKIALKHMLRKFQTLSSSPKGRNEVASYLGVLIDAFENCQTRQAMELNQVMAGLGLQDRQNKGKEDVLWSWINEFKLEAFKEFTTTEGRDITHVHIYARMFTAVNNTIGLPVAMQGFKERLSMLTDGEIEEHLGQYLGLHFTPLRLIGFIYEKIKAEEVHPDSLYSLNARMLMVNKEAEGAAVSDSTGKKPEAHPTDEYFLRYTGSEIDEENFDSLESPITKGEVRRLLELTGVLRETRVPSSTTTAAASAGG